MMPANRAIFMLSKGISEAKRAKSMSTGQSHWSLEHDHTYWAIKLLYFLFQHQLYTLEKNQSIVLIRFVKKGIMFEDVFGIGVIVVQIIDPCLTKIEIIIFRMSLQGTDSSTVYDLPAYCFTYCDEHCIQSTIDYQYKASLFFSIATILVSAYHIYMHLHNFNNPFFQSKIIVILIMAPFYCITSMGSFIFPSMEIYFTLTRDSYEALLLFTFFYLMFSYLAYDRQTDKMEDKKVYTIMIKYQKEVHHFWPFGYCQKPYQLTHWKKAKYFTYRCKKWVMQFLVVKVFTTLLMYIIYPNQHGEAAHDQGQVSSHSTYNLVSSLVSWTVGISASYSLYYLVLFYHALNKPLAPYSALLKFLTIKITIFFTFWQKIMIGIFQQQFLSCFNQDAQSYNKMEILTSLQNTLICFQMLLMAIAGGLAYNYQNYVSRLVAKSGNFGYVIQDTIRSFKNDFRLIKPKKFGFDPNKQKGIIQMQQLQLHSISPATMASRKSIICDVKIKNKIMDCMVDNYL